jgi:glycosyltransferase involved in cell wall biosynthesis
VKVVYDASPLALAQRYPRNRSGVVRAIDGMLRTLAGRPECDLQLFPGTSARSLDGVLEYVRTRPALGSAPVLFSRWSAVPRQLAQWRRRTRRRTAARRVPAPGDPGTRARRGILDRLAIAGGQCLQRHAPDGWRAIRDADVFHSHLTPVPAEIRRPGKPRCLVTIFDVIPLIAPEHFTPDTVAWMHTLLASTGPDDWFLCVSERTRDDLCERAAVPAARVFVSHLAAAPDLFYPCREPDRIAAVRERYGIPEGPYLLSLGKLEPRKNLVALIHVFERLVREENVPDLSLVLAGERGWQCDALFETVASHAQLGARIVFTGYVEDEDLAPLYSGALTFAYPSIYEGFGLPPLEAMQCGTPVVTSNTSSLPEVVGEAGLMLPPTDTDAWCHALRRIYRDAAYRQFLGARGISRAAGFSWERCGERIVAAYRAVQGSG